MKTVWLTRELLATGKSRRQIHDAVRADLIHHVARGIYSTTPPDDPQKLRCLVHAHPDLVFGGLTAAQLYTGLSVTWPACGILPPNRSRDAGTLLRISRRTRRRIRLIHDLPVDTPVQVVADLGTDAPASLLRLYSGGAGRKALLDADLGELTGPERDRVRPMMAGTGTASGLETRAITLIRDALRPELEQGLITVEANVTVRGYCFDIVIGSARVLIEIDSYLYHGEHGAKTTERSHLRDRWKGNMASRWGWTLLRYTDSDVDWAGRYMAEQVADTVRFALRTSRRRRRDDEAIPTDAPVWTWHPLMVR